MARIRGAKIFALGIGTSKFEKFIPKMLMRIILLLAKDFAVRDRTSFDDCSVLGDFNCLRKTADLVYSLPIDNEIVEKNNKSTSHNSITLRSDVTSPRYSNS